MRGNDIVPGKVKNTEPESRHLPSLRQLLLLLALACVVPVAALALAFVAFEYHDQRQQVERNTIATARALMAAVDDRLQGTQRALIALAHAPATSTSQLERMQMDSVLLQRAEQFDTIMLVDGAGRPVMNSAVPHGSPLPHEAVPQMLDAVRSQQPVVMDLFRSPATGRFLTGVGVPAPDHGGGPGAFNATIAPDALREVLVRQKLPASWIAVVLDRSGTVVARTHEQERFVGTRARAPLLARISEVPEDAVESTSLDGVPVITAFSRSDLTGWSVAIGIPRDELTAPTWRLVGALMLGGAVVLAGSLGLAWWLARRLHNSVEALGAAVRATGHNARLRLPPPAFQEARQLGLSFAYAHTALEDAHAALARNETRMRTILDTATDAIVTADESGRIVLFNAAAEAMFGLSETYALGQPIESLVPVRLRAGHEALRRQAAQGGVRSMGSGRIVEGLRSDGSTFRVQASISVADEGEGRLYTAILRKVAQPQTEAA